MSAVKVDNEYENMYKLDSGHFFDHPKSLQPRDVLERLIRKNQAYKTGVLHALNLQDEKFELLNVINGVDFLQHWGQPNSSFDVELSYTWLDYRIME